MNMKSFFVFFAVAFALFFAGCDKEEILPEKFPNPATVKVRVKIEERTPGELTTPKLSYICSFEFENPRKDTIYLTHFALRAGFRYGTAPAHPKFEGIYETHDTKWWDYSHDFYYMNSSYYSYEECRGFFGTTVEVKGGGYSDDFLYRGILYALHLRLAPGLNTFRLYHEKCVDHPLPMGGTSGQILPIYSMWENTLGEKHSDSYYDKSTVGVTVRE